MPIADKKKYLEQFNPPLFALNWQLNELLRSISCHTILDVTDSLAITAPMLINTKEKKVYSVDPERAPPLVAQPNIDMALMVFSLLFFANPLAAMETIAGYQPEYIIHSDQFFTPGQLTAAFPGARKDVSWIKDIFTKKMDLKIDSIFNHIGYHPIEVFTSRLNHPAHTLESVVYTKDKPDRKIYDQASYIIQINSACNFNCEGCYVEKLGETMPPDIFQKILKQVEPAQTISLRGGEPALTANLIGEYIRPALDKGIHVILESNGSFIEKPVYESYRALFAHSLFEIRLSLDRRHESAMTDRQKKTYFKSLYCFYEEALQNKYRFGFFALGMTRKQIHAYLKELGLEALQPHVKPLTRYHDISVLPIKGKFVDLHGQIHTRIVGVKHDNEDF